MNLLLHSALISLMAALLCGGVSAQPTTDTLQTVNPDGEIVQGYQSLLQQYAQLRRVEEAGQVGGRQDGLQRMEIDGLVVDETQTRLGLDFYTEFFAFWQAPEGAINYTVTIQEQPMPNLGTRVMVSVNDEIAFQAQLQPRQEMIEAASRQAVFLTYRFVQGLSSREAYVY